MPNNDTKIIKERLNVADVIGSYLQLRKAGVNYVAKCPFHNEKSASFNVSPVRQIWHCFGCGVGGDIFDFVMKVENVEFFDALKILADKAGVTLQTAEPDTKKDEKADLIRINDFASRLYHEVLLNDKRAAAARAYLEKRGLDKDTIIKWRIGFAPDEFHFMEQALVGKKVTPRNMIDSGLVIQNEAGKRYDRFRGRVTFPIFDYLGNIVGFSARILVNDPNQAKYINSPETPIYNKSKVLFGLYFAKNAARKKDQIIFVEGQMDAISPSRVGIEHVIATSGTAVTEDHIRSVMRITKNLVLSFDSDVAGTKALHKTGKIAMALGCNVKVLMLPEGKDPDELISRDPTLFEKAAASAVWFIDYFILRAQSDFKDRSVEQKKYISAEVLPLLDLLTDPIEKDHYQKELAQRFSISPQSLVDAKSSSVKQQVTGKSDITSFDKLTQEVDLEKIILGGMLASPEFAEFVKANATADMFSTMYAGTFVRDLLLGESAQVVQSKFAQEAGFMVELLKQNTTDEGLLKVLQRAFYNLQLKSIKSTQQRLTAEIKQAEIQGKPEVTADLTAAFAKITKQRLEIEKRLV